MAIRILLVDDERLERSLIRRSVDWSKMGVQIIGEASDADEALEFYRKEHPEIVFTDINMPFTDGLELSEQLKKDDPNVKIVIITGYQDFEYARTAIRIGVKDFLLKPIQSKELKDTVLRLKKELSEEETLQLKLQAGMPLLANQLCRRIADGQVRQEDLTDELERCGLPNVFNDDLICCLISPANLLPETFSAKQAIAALLPEKMQYLLFQEREGLYCILTDTPWPEETSEKLQRELSRQWDMPVTVAVSDPSRGLQGAHLCYEEASKCLLGCILLGKNTVISYRMYSSLERSGESDCVVDFSRYEFALKAGLEKQTVSFVNQYLAHYSDGGISSVEQLHTIGIVLLHHTSLALNQVGLRVTDVQSDIYSLVSKSSTLDEFCAAFYPFLTSVLQLVKNDFPKSSSGLIVETEKYLEQNLSVPKLSLKTVAAALYVNESYLSRIFKQIKGETVTEYIMRRRIENSIQLMKTTDLKVYEISDRVGIPDAHYFGQCFKKYMDMSVNQFKSKN